jgi:hypothetical protein
LESELKRKKTVSRKQRKPSPKPKRLEVTRAQLADLLGVSPDHVTRMTSAGMPRIRSGSGRGRTSVYDAVAAMAWVRERELGDGPAAKNFRDAYLQALTTKANLDIDDRRAQLVRRDVVVDMGTRFVTAAKARLMALPRHATAAGVPRQYETVLDGLVREALRELSRWQTIDAAERDEVAAATVDAKIPKYYTAAEVSSWLSDPRSWLTKVEPGLRQRLSDWAAAGRGIVRYRSGGISPWPPPLVDDDVDDLVVDAKENRGAK